MTIVAPLKELEEPEPAGARGVARFVYSLVNWMIMLPFVVPHEASHVVASRLFGLRVNGGGVVLGHTGTLRGYRLPRIHGFYIQHERTSDARSFVISMAPAFWFVPCAILQQAGMFWPALFCLIVGMTVISDVMVVATMMFYGEERMREMTGKNEAKYVYLVGEPDQWQTELSRYE